MKTQEHPGLRHWAFPQTQSIHDYKVVCGNYYTQKAVGETLLGWSEVNQFAVVYLEIIPVNLRRSLGIFI